jgi:hypothetical protein
MEGEGIHWGGLISFAFFPLFPQLSGKYQFELEFGELDVFSLFSTPCAP